MTEQGTQQCVMQQRKANASRHMTDKYVFVKLSYNIYWLKRNTVDPIEPLRMCLWWQLW